MMMVADGGATATERPTTLLIIDADNCKTTSTNRSTYVWLVPSPPFVRSFFCSTLSLSLSFSPSPFVTGRRISIEKKYSRSGYPAVWRWWRTNRSLFCPYTTAYPKLKLLNDCRYSLNATLDRNGDARESLFLVLAQNDDEGMGFYSLFPPFSCPSSFSNYY